MKPCLIESEECLISQCRWLMQSAHHLEKRLVFKINVTEPKFRPCLF